VIDKKATTGDENEDGYGFNRKGDGDNGNDGDEKKKSHLRGVTWKNAHHSR
jgi:hypothetical protein